MSTNPAPKDLADATWKQVFQEGPYTAVVMIDYLRAQAGHADWSVVLKAGYTNKKGLTGLAPAALKKEAIKKDKNLNVIWGGKTGRCTSFAVKVLDQLEKKSPGTFDFKIYDIGRHRVARCAKTEVLIDSSAKDGAFALPEGQWTRMEGSDASWKWVKGQSKFEKREGVSGVKFSETIISKEDALVTCLFELPEASSIPTLFRSIDPKTKKSVYHAMMKWSWKTKSLDIIPNLSNTRKIVVQFGGQGGTDATNLECLTMLAAAMNQDGGPNAQAQWAAVETATMSIWEGAVKTWGNPTWSATA